MRLRTQCTGAAAEAGGSSLMDRRSRVAMDRAVRITAAKGMVPAAGGQTLITLALAAAAHPAWYTLSGMEGHRRRGTIREIQTPRAKTRPRPSNSAPPPHTPANP